MPVTTAVLGGEAQVPTITGSVRLKIPGNSTQSGQVFRLKGHGMPVVGKPDTRGDLLRHHRVQLYRPAGGSLTKEQREHYEALGEARESRVMNLNKYTEKAQEAILAAQQLADREGHPEILTRASAADAARAEEDGSSRPSRKMNPDPAALAARCARSSNGCRVPTVDRRSRSPPRLRRLRRAAEQEAERLKDEFEHRSISSSRSPAKAAGPPRACSSSEASRRRRSCRR